MVALSAVFSKETTVFKELDWKDAKPNWLQLFDFSLLFVSFKGMITLTGLSLKPSLMRSRSIRFRLRHIWIADGENESKIQIKTNSELL